MLLAPQAAARASHVSSPLFQPTTQRTAAKSGSRHFIKAASRRALAGRCQRYPSFGSRARVQQDGASGSRRLALASTRRETAGALREVDLAHVRCGSLATEEVEAARPYMSALLPKAVKPIDASVRQLCAISRHMQRSKPRGDGAPYPPMRSRI